MEGVDGRLALGVEGHVHAPGGAALVDPEVVAAAEAESRRPVVRVGQRYPLEAERSERELVEAKAFFEIANADADVVNDPYAITHVTKATEPRQATCQRTWF